MITFLTVKRAKYQTPQTLRAQTFQSLYIDEMSPYFRSRGMNTYALFVPDCTSKFSFAKQTKLLIVNVLID